LPAKPEPELMPKKVPDVDHVVTAVEPLGSIRASGNVVVPLPPVKMEPKRRSADVDAAPAACTAIAPVNALVPDTDHVVLVLMAP
jgi:hypothetical protein